jgi:hypothetical protein
MDPIEPTDYNHFSQRALVLGCRDEEASLWAEIALRRGWSFAVDVAEFDNAVLDYLVSVGAGDSWQRDLEKLLETTQ